MNRPIAPSVSSTFDQVLLRTLFMTSSPRVCEAAIMARE